MDELEIIIVDNCSGEDSKTAIEKLCSYFKNVKAIFLNDKISFSGANNTGVNAASSEILLIMNPDIIFAEPVLNKLIRRLETVENLGAVSPALIGSDGKFQYDYFQRYPTIIQYLIYQTFISKLFLKFPKIVNKYISNHNIKTDPKTLYFTEQIPCAFFLTKKSIFNEAGTMDENFELFFEDVDLCYRIHKKHKLAVDTSVKVTHIGGSSLRTANNWWLYGKVTMSMNRFFDKHYNFIRAFLLKIISVSNSVLTLAFEYIKKIFGKPDYYRIKKHKYFLKLFRERYL